MIDLSRIAGTSATTLLRVDEPRIIKHIGERIRVYSTPSLVADVEQACWDIMLPYMPEGWNSVGIHVCLDHTGPALLGAEVAINAAVVEIVRSALTFRIRATCDGREIAAGYHKRFGIEVARMEARLEATRGARIATDRGSGSEAS